VIALKMWRLRLFTALAFAGVILLPSETVLAAGSKAAEAEGATLFRDKGCAYCHGATAQGTQKAPSLANVRKTLKPAQIAAQIENGGQKMPSFEDSLSKDEVAQLVAFLRAKHRPAPAPVVTKPQTPAAVVNPEQ
jgi:mono/diheme cytochrome c family protein